MVVSWNERHWFDCFDILLNRLKPGRIPFGTLRISLDETKPLGKLAIKNEAGETVCYLIDNLAIPQKIFHLPVDFIKKGFSIRSETDELLFYFKASNDIQEFAPKKNVSETEPTAPE